MSLEFRLNRIRQTLSPLTRLNRTAVAKELGEKGFVTLPKDTRVDTTIETSERTKHVRMRLTNDHEVEMERDGVFVLDSPERRRTKKLYDETRPITDILIAADQLAPPDERGLEDEQIEPVVNHIAAYLAQEIFDRELTTDFLIKEPEIGERYDAMEVQRVYFLTKMSDKGLKQDKSK
jgi:hypothetical protein